MGGVRLTHRPATRADLNALRAVMDAAITELQKPFLDSRQIESSRMVMGLDTQLIDDGTYFIVELNGVVAGCGGWSRRATLYGSDQTPGRNAGFLDPTARRCQSPSHVHPSCTYSSRYRPPGPQAMRNGCQGGRVLKSRAHGYDGRRAPISGMRVRAN